MFNKVSSEVFSNEFELAAKVNTKIAESCSSVSDIEGAFYIQKGDNYVSGFCVTSSGELTHVFSTGKGKGKDLVLNSIELGATNLNCFDGYLTSFYTALGFKEVSREKNWDVKGPDVIFMEVA